MSKGRAILRGYDADNEDNTPCSTATMREPLQKRNRYDPSLQNKENLSNSEAIVDADSRSDSETNTYRQ